MSEQTPTLEEKFSSLREQGLKDKDIVRQLFQENLDTSVPEICRITGMGKLDVGRIKGQVSRWAKRREKKEEKKVEPPTLYKTEPNANAILDEILSSHPDIPAKVKDEIMDWARRRGSLDPGLVAYLLSSMKGVSSTTAHIVSQKYAFALQKAQFEGRLQTPYPIYTPMPQQPAPFVPPPLGYPPQPFQYPLQPSPLQPPTLKPGTPSYYSPQYPLPPQDVAKVVKDEIGEVKSYVDKKFEEIRPKEEAYAYIEEPMRTPDGKILVDEKGQPIVRRMRVPATQAAQLSMGGDPETRLLAKLESYKNLFKGDLTADDVRKIVKDEAGEKGKEPPITKKDVEEASTKVAETVLAKKAEEDKDERRHRETLEAIKTSGGSRVVEGYKSDSYRFLGQSMDKLANVIEKKEPVKVVIHGVRDILSESPPAKEVEAGAKEGIFKHVKSEYVVEA